LLAFSATAVHASPKATAEPATDAAAKQPPTPIDLAVPAAATEPAAPIDPAPVVVDPLQTAPLDVQEVVGWIARSGDNSRLPFLVIDKPSARVYAFDPAGRFQGDAPVLLGMGVGDRMLLPSAKMSQMPPHTRITPAGRFVSKLARDAKGKELLVLDYKAAFSLHPVVKGKPHERRADRHASVTGADNRISFGCINVPVPFYEGVISRAFARTHGIVYILPETSQASAMFGFTPVIEALAYGPPEATLAAPPATPARPHQVAPTGPQPITAAGPRPAAPAAPQPVTTALNGPAGQTAPEAAAE
jgi:hypothetical protein